MRIINKKSINKLNIKSNFNIIQRTLKIIRISKKNFKISIINRSNIRIIKKNKNRIKKELMNLVKMLAIEWKSIGRIKERNLAKILTKLIIILIINKIRKNPMNSKNYHNNLMICKYQIKIKTSLYYKIKNLTIVFRKNFKVLNCHNHWIK